MELQSVLVSSLETVAETIKGVFMAIIPVGVGVAALKIATRNGLGFFKSVTK